MSLRNISYEPGHFDLRDDLLARRLKQDHIPREPKRAALVNREKRVADGEERAEELGLPKMPKGFAMAMHAYSHTSQARTNSKRCDDLVKAGQEAARIAFAKLIGDDKS
jgi:hypothetical protein